MFDFFHVLLLLHIGGAIIGIGPTFAFGLMTPMMHRASAEGSRWIYETLVAINTKMVWPVLVLQPITGALLIFESGRNENFFSQEWLWISILIYAVLFALALFLDRPAQAQLLQMVRSSDTDNPRYAALRGRQDRLGMLLGVMVVVIIVLMISKPGA